MSDVDNETQVRLRAATLDEIANELLRRMKGNGSSTLNEAAALTATRLAQIVERLGNTLRPNELLALGYASGVLLARPGRP